MHTIEERITHVIGIDEAGRGPLAGPVAVGAVMVRRDKIDAFRRLFTGVRDSKKLSPQKRRQWFALLRDAEKAGLLEWKVAFTNAHVIDRHGIRFAVFKGIRSVLSRLAPPTRETHVLLDGGLKAPRQYGSQTTIIHGDDSEMIISLASIAAKVLRDRKMEAFSMKYPDYGLEEHKGYGTAAHYRQIRKYGLTDIHRKSFCKEYANAI